MPRTQIQARRLSKDFGVRGCKFHPIISAHPGNPWQDEQLSVAPHKPNVYIDLSGWAPKYFEPKLVQFANTLLKHKVLFGSDNTVIQPHRWLAEFDKLLMKDEVRALIINENAAKLLKLR